MVGRERLLTPLSFQPLLSFRARVFRDIINGMQPLSMQVLEALRFRKLSYIIAAISSFLDFLKSIFQLAVIASLTLIHMMRPILTQRLIHAYAGSSVCRLINKVVRLTGMLAVVMLLLIYQTLL